MIRRARLCLTLAIAAALGCGGSASADTIHGQLDAARSAYDAGDLRGTVQTLEFAIAKIQEQITARLWTLLPDPLPGWQADEPASQSLGILNALTGTNLSRRYYDEEGAEIEISIVADSPLIGMMGMMFANPMLLQATPVTSSFLAQGYRGILEHEKGSQDWDMKLMLGGRVLVELRGSGLEDKAPIQAFLEAMDLKAIEKTMTE